jgi:hypothetical protein
MMLAFVLVAVAGPLLSLLVRAVGGPVSNDWLAMSSPVGGAMAIVADKSEVGAAAAMSGEQWVFTLVLLASGLLAWGLAALTAREDA